MPLWMYTVFGRLRRTGAGGGAHARSVVILWKERSEEEEESEGWGACITPEGVRTSSGVDGSFGVGDPRSAGVSNVPDVGTNNSGDDGAGTPREEGGVGNLAVGKRVYFGLVSMWLMKP